MHFGRSGLRTALLVLLVGAVFTVYVMRLMQVQIVEGERYKAILNQGSTGTQVVEAARGEILDRYGNPLAINTTGYNLVLDRAFLPSEEQNRIILDLTKILTAAGEGWIDNLPLEPAPPFSFKEGEEYAYQVERLKKDIEVQMSASAQDVLYWLVDRYALEGFSPTEQRTIAGIRYEMERRGFNKDVRYTFAENVSLSTVAKVKERSVFLPGVDAVDSPIRQYVSGTTAPHIVGFIGPIYKEEYEERYDEFKADGYEKNDTIGKAGIEKYFEKQLRGKPGSRSITMNAQGDVIDVIDEVEPTPGNTVVLTLDSTLQQVAGASLEKQIKNLQQTAREGEGKEANAGCVVAIDCKTGAVLVAANYPSYDMATYRADYSALAADPRNPLFNRCFDGTYAAGSCFKPVVATAGLAQGLITAESTITCTHVYTRFQGYQPKCLGTHGAITVLDALRWSCNIFFYELGFQLGIDTIDRYATQFGLGQPTGLEVHEEIGEVSSPAVKLKHEPDNPWTGGDVVQSAIGQLYNNFSPLQLANYAATIANRGTRMKVHVVQSIESYTFDKTISVTQPEVAEVVDAPREAFETVVDGMVRASRIGTSANYGFGDYPIDVASKTGTPETKQYPNSTFIAFAPADDPQIAVGVVIENGWHGYTGAPVAKDIFDQYFFSADGQTAPAQVGELLP